ncbi:MAG: Nudix family hydrolase [Gammaproteobacteria bacterium]|nr:Nudix family hydrolase [Gammaproteobacteria bacterium]MCW8986314.1 Nudix family hydrolase [Gammaproteobacteria bacterium]MCW9031310.1 Nudix family hydrolase [Gammaproteobacteria bacterium]
MSFLKKVHVAVAVIKNQHGQIFIAKRPKDSHQGGLWEFPGGKVENNETVLAALKRELVEEVGISLVHASSLIRIHHDYTDKSVLLDVWCVDNFAGKAFGKEGQKTCWVNVDDLAAYDFPDANLPIIKALNLPDRYMITGKFDSEAELLSRIQSGLEQGIKLIQFRAPGLDEDVYFNYAEKIYSACQEKKSKLFLNTSYEKFRKFYAAKFSHGLHLNSEEIALYTSENKDEELLTSTSIHNYDELLMAEEKNIDFAVLSPVNKTLSHPDSVPIGWEYFKELTDKTNMPVFALGGMTEKDIIIAKEHGGHGIASIGAFWKS